MIKAEYVDHMGDDLRVANAARVSFDKESEWAGCEHMEALGCDVFCPCHDDNVGKLKDQDEKLISYLSRHNHFTPFTHCVVTLRETVPIFVARQRFKHVVGFTYNEVSRRYVDTPPTFYWPDSWRERAVNKKQGSGEDLPYEARLDITHLYNGVLATAQKSYERALELGLCPEQARMFLPQSMETSYYVTGSLMAFARAYSLRKDPHAQKEIQDLAHEWDRIIRPLYPSAWSSLVD